MVDTLEQQAKAIALSCSGTIAFLKKTAIARYSKDRR